MTVCVCVGRRVSVRPVGVHSIVFCSKTAAAETGKCLWRRGRGETADGGFLSVALNLINNTFGDLL